MVTALLLLILSVNGRITEVQWQYLNCSYYSDRTYVSSTAKSQAIAMDVCRTYVTPSDTTYRMYKCNGTNVFDEVYATSDCTGTPTDIELIPESTPNDGYECVIDFSNICQYIMMKTPCDGDICYWWTIIMATTSGESYQWVCNNEDDQLEEQLSQVYLYYFDSQNGLQNGPQQNNNIYTELCEAGTERSPATALLNHLKLEPV